MDDQQRDDQRDERDDDNADTLPALPSKDDDSPLGDTDQHSDVPSDRSWRSWPRRGAQSR